MSSQFSLFRSRRFSPLFITQFLGAFNDQTFKNGFMALLTYRLADEQNLNIDFHALLASAIFILPFALCAPTAGQLADSMDKARMMRRVKFSEILLMCLAAFGYHFQSLPVLYVLLFLMGAQSAFFSPIKYGVLPQYLKREELLAGNGLIQAATFAAIILGQIAGIKLVLSSDGVVIVSVAVILIAIAGFIASLFAPAAPSYAQTKVDWTFLRPLIRIIGECRQHREPFAAILYISWFWFVGATFMSFVLPLAKENLNASSDAALVILTAFIVGVAVGSMLTNAIAKSTISYSLVPIGALGIAIGALLTVAAVRWHEQNIGHAAELFSVGEFLSQFEGWLVLVGFALLALMAGLYVTPLNAIYQAAAPKEARGRFVACSNMIDSVSMVFSSIFAMILLMLGFDRIDILSIVAVSGVVMAWITWRHHRRIGNQLEASFYLDD